MERLELLLDEVHAVFYQLGRNAKELTEESLHSLLSKIQARGILTLLGVRYSIFPLLIGNQATG